MTRGYLVSGAKFISREELVLRGSDSGGQNLIVTISESFAALVPIVMRKLQDARQTVATAESCTGGILATAFTTLPGSSAVYIGGVSSYANSAKSKLLDVDPALILAHGAVSQEVAIKMSEGVRKELGADWAISVTGVAGPDGGSAEKPVGTVWFGLAGPRGSAARVSMFSGDRSAVRMAAAEFAMQWLVEELG